MFYLFGLPFHYYGLILGLSAVLCVWLMALKARQHHLPAEELESMAFWVIIGGVLGARLYHVLTDLPVYVHDPAAMIKVWEGGLSIIGAVIGGVLTLKVIQVITKPQTTWLQILDIAAFGLPFAQAVGRIGNWVNQELYGAPTNLPWGIAIDSDHRLAGYQQFSRFHPLFAYELLLMSAFGIGLWLLDRQVLKVRGSKTASSSIAGWSWQLGSGQFFLLYVLYYSVIRTLLDVLRLDKALLIGSIGVNQVVLSLLAVVAALCLFRQRKHAHV